MVCTHCGYLSTHFVGDGRPGPGEETFIVFWCPNCGTIRYKNGNPYIRKKIKPGDVQVPRLIEALVIDSSTVWPPVQSQE